LIVAWSESKHPRAANGQFRPKGAQTLAGKRVSREEAGRIMFGDAGYRRRTAKKRGRR
jgi:hypothetical protein